MDAHIIKQNLDQEFYTSEKCYITEVSNSAADPEASIARARVLPGVTTRWHYLSTSTERYYMISGIGRVEVGDQPPHDVHTGDVVLIPPKCRQRICNTGDEDLVFIAICTPRFSKDDYVEIETDSSH